MVYSQSQCQYISFDWDLVSMNLANMNGSGASQETLNNLQSTLRRFDDDDPTNKYFLPPVPKIALDPNNESYSNIPYPIDVCLESGSTTSYKFICDQDNLPRIERYDRNNKCNGEAVISSVLSDGIIDFNCGGSDSCPYIEINEIYYDPDQDENEGCNSPLYNQTFKGIYAVDVCIQNSIGGSFKYLCDPREETYTFTSYSDTGCFDDAVEESIEFNICFDDMIAISNDTDEDIQHVATSFIGCTRSSDYEQTLQDRCPSSQVRLIYDNTIPIASYTSQIGPFGQVRLPNRDLRLFQFSNNSNLDCGAQNFGQWNDTILIIGESDTNFIVNNCSNGTQGFVMDIQQSSTVEAIIFTSEETAISSVIVASNEIAQIPTRIISTTGFSQIDTGSITGQIALECNNLEGYPVELCVYVTCNNPYNCPEIVYSGTYLIQVNIS